MEKFSTDAEKIMIERFGRDTVIALATQESGLPYVRYVDAYYENGSFYVITHALSNKMTQIGRCKTVALAGEWFSAHGDAVSLGSFKKPENNHIAQKLRKVFSSWLDNGHSNLEDENTIILCIELTDAVLFSHGTRYEL